MSPSERIGAARVAGGMAGLALAVALLMLAVGDGWGRVVVVAVVLVLVTLAAYVVGAVAVARRSIGEPSASDVPAQTLEMSMIGLTTGIAAGVNFGVWALIPFGWPIGSVVGAIGLGAAIAPIARRRSFQAVLGWTSWLMPFSYLATAPGILLFLVNLPFALARYGGRAVRFDAGTGTIETTGGIVGVTGFRGGFNLGTFTFLCPSPERGLAIQSPFGSPGLSAHESGHALSLAALGGLFHWINAVDENVPPLARKRFAYGELIAESHIPRPPPNRHLRVWS